MRRTTTILRYTLVGAVVLILGGLSGWFFYLHSQSSATSELGQNRGYGITTPLFGAPNGSTQSNIQQSIGSGATVLPSTNDTSSQLWRVDATPVAGFGFEQALCPTTIICQGESSSTVRYDLDFVERGSGNVFQADFATRSTVRLSDTLMAKTSEAYFAPGEGVVERSVDGNGTITTFQGKISTTTPTDTTSTSTPEELVGADLSANISTFSLNPSNGMLAYLIEDANGMTDLVQAPWTSSKGKPKTLFSSAIGSWRVMSLPDGRVILLESPADNVQGYAYSVSASGALTQLASGPGLTVTPDTGSTAIIYGTSQGGALTLFTQVSSKTTPIATSISTVADKCAWLPGKSMIAYCAVPASIPSQTFLNDWYRGAVHTSDSWYEIDASTGSTTLIYEPRSGVAPIDAENPMVDPTGTYVVFLNKIDNSLWALNIAQ